MLLTLLALFILNAGPVHGASAAPDCFPPPDSQGGWRALHSATEIRCVAGMDRAKLDEAFAVAAASSKNGGLLIVRHGWLVYENYFGLAGHDTAPNLASCGKSVTSIAMGILMAEHPGLFPDGLDQKVFTPQYLPMAAFPLADPAMAEIRLGQLLSFTAGIRGNNPCIVMGRKVTIDPPGPDGWEACVDDIALGRKECGQGRQRLSTATLWCRPGAGYSYATASAHIASMIVRHVSGLELQDYVQTRLAQPLGWERWGWGYRAATRGAHTPGGGGIALRPTDMLRLGFLLLHEGNWGGRQVVPAGYVRACSHPSPYNPHFPYSLQFNVNANGEVPELPRDAFWKAGSGGHALYVVPSLDLVVWKPGGRDSQYAERDTGLPLPAASRQGTAARKNWKQTMDDQTALRATLQKVVEAITH